MKIQSNPLKSFCNLHFVFLEDDLILQKKYYSPDKFELKAFIDNEQVESFLEAQVVSDWFNDLESDTTTLLLEKDCALKSEFIRVPVRQIFWDLKDDEKLISLISRNFSLIKQRCILRYCPTCSGKLVTDKEYLAKKCSICGRQFFPRIEPAVIVLVQKGEKILLVKAKNRKSGVYSCVSGFVEVGETIFQCVEREVLEETGIKVKNIQFVSNQFWPYPDQLMFAFTAEYESGEIEIQEEELYDAGWFNIYSLPELPKPGSVAYDLITKYVKK